SLSSLRTLPSAVKIRLSGSRNEPGSSPEIELATPVMPRLGAYRTNRLSHVLAAAKTVSDTRLCQGGGCTRAWRRCVKTIAATGVQRSSRLGSSYGPSPALARCWHLPPH